jgi:hypothetical protein
MNEKEKRLRKNFENHVATIDQLAYFDVNADEDAKIDIRMEVLKWKKPDSSSYMIKYILTGNTLCVYGDLGEAIYRWSSPITFKWLSELDLSYFKGKCQASEVGRDFKEWDESQARKSLKQFAKDEYFEWKNFEESDGLNSLYSKNDWREWVSHCGAEVLGEYFWEWAYSIGDTIHTRCLYHFIGIKMAVEQMEKNETV